MNRALKGLIFGIFIIFICAGIIIIQNRFYKNRLKAKFNQLLTAKIGEYDISQMPLKDCKKSFSGNVWLISYAGGDDVHFKNQRVLNATANLNCIKKIISYDRYDLDKDFLIKNRDTLKYKRGAGSWVWKSYIVYKTLQNIPDGDILFYADVGVKLVRPINELIEDMLKNKQDMLYIGYDDLKRSLRMRIKQEVVDYFKLNDNFMDKNYIRMGLIRIVINNKHTRNFYKELLRISQIPGLISDIPIDKNNQHPDFIGHIHDDSMLSILLHLNKDKYEKTTKIMQFPSEEFSKYFCQFHRRKKETTIPLLGCKEALEQDENFMHPYQDRQAWKSMPFHLTINDYDELIN